MKLPEKSVSITFWLIDLYGNIFRCVRWVGWLVLPFQKFTQCFWTVTEFLKDLWLLRHLITVMRQHDLTKKNYLPTYPPTYLPTYLCTSVRKHLEGVMRRLYFSKLCYSELYYSKCTRLTHLLSFASFFGCGSDVVRHDSYKKSWSGRWCGRVWP